jgi:hypothetical protein
MAKADLMQVLEIVQALDTDELRQLQRAVQARLDATGEVAARKAFHQALLDSGLVKQIKTPAVRPDTARPLVPIQGKPLSETIVEERR